MSSQHLIHRAAWLGALSCLLNLLSPATASAGEVNAAFAGYKSIRDFGAAASHTPAANKAALQRAIDWAAPLGAALFVDPSDEPYPVDGGLILKRNVSLIGVHGPVGRGTRHPDKAQPVGSVFRLEAKQSHALNYTAVRQGKVVRRRTLMKSTEDKPGLIGSAGRFQVTPDQRLFAVCYAAGTEAGGRRVAENRILEILPDGSAGAPVRLPLAKPFTSYFTATVRAGSPPSRTLEMLGPRAGAGNTISYARVWLFPEP